MKLMLNIFFAIFFYTAHAQLAIFPQPSSTCGNYVDAAGIYLDGQPLFNENHATGNRKLELNENGMITIRTFQKVGEKLRDLEHIRFVLAVIDGRTGTQRIIGLNEHTEISLSELRKHLDVGDSVVFMTVDAKHALPSHKLVFNWGC